MSLENYTTMGSLDGFGVNLVIPHHMPTSTEPFRVVVAAGGTGGHIFPAVAVVERLLEQTSGACQAVFLGSADRMETTLIPQLGYRFVPMPITGFRGVMSVSTLSLPFKIWKSITIARNVLREVRPHAVICTGAYISYPAGIAAIKEGVPLFVLESNLNPGKANARLVSKATAVVLAFEESRKYYSDAIADKLHVLGNPVRTQIDASHPAAIAREAFGLHPSIPTVLVFGGSLGARSINTAMENALGACATAPFQVLWQTGKGWSSHAEIPKNVAVRPFIDDMGLAYAAADVVVCRSGATTLAELALVGKPAVFVPLQTASMNEQALNAQVAQQRGAAVIIRDDQLQERLFATMSELLNDEIQRNQMAVAMKAMGRPAAADAVAHLIRRLALREHR